MEEENVTVLPWQNGFAEAKIEMEPGNGVFVCITNGTEVTGFPVTHVRLEVSRQVITSPLTGIKFITE